MTKALGIPTEIESISKIKFEGPKSKNPLAFRSYNPTEKIAGKTIEEHCSFAMAYWHTMRANGSDMFGPGTFTRPWETGDSIENAENRIRVGFSLMEKLGIKNWCFHDVDLMTGGYFQDFSVASYEKELLGLVEVAKSEMKRTGISLGWGTSNLFSHPIYAHGASTSPDPKSYAFAAAQVKVMLDVTKELGGKGFVFWGGREGYETILNTDVRKELDQMASFMRSAVEYGDKIGFTGRYMVEPKPFEPTHMYSKTTTATLEFLRRYDLYDRVGLNVEMNHATLAGIDPVLELKLAAIQKKLWGIDLNQGDRFVGYDTDHFPSDVYLSTMMALTLLENGGIAPGVINFDAKVRRQSSDPLDLIYAHILGMDTMARGFRVAAAIKEDGRYAKMIEERYQAWETTELGRQISDGANLEHVYIAAKSAGSATALPSGKEELITQLINDYLYAGV